MNLQIFLFPYYHSLLLKTRMTDGHASDGHYFVGQWKKYRHRDPSVTNGELVCKGYTVYIYIYEHIQNEGATVYINVFYSSGSIDTDTLKIRPCHAFKGSTSYKRCYTEYICDDWPILTSGSINAILGQFPKNTKCRSTRRHFQLSQQKVIDLATEIVMLIWFSKIFVADLKGVRRIWDDP